MIENMTLEEARKYLEALRRDPFGGACACLGGPECCILRFKKAKQLIAEAESEH